MSEPTNQQRANYLVTELWNEFAIPSVSFSELVAAVAKALDAAEQRENEACALLTESMIGARPRETAEAIRQRRDRRKEEV